MKSFQEDTLLQRVALICMLILLSPIVLISWILFKSIEWKENLIKILQDRRIIK